jgi:hypothetical protein
LNPSAPGWKTLRSLQVDAATWDRNARAAGYLNHRDKRLTETVALRGIEGYRHRMVPMDFDYLAACEIAERAMRHRQRLAQVALSVLAFGVVVGMAAWIEHDNIKQAWQYLTITQPFVQLQFRPYVLTAYQERALKPGDAFRECGVEAEDSFGGDRCPEMIVIPAGSFFDGIPRNGKRAPRNRRPAAQRHNSKGICGIQV